MKSIICKLQFVLLAVFILFKDAVLCASHHQMTPKLVAIFYDAPQRQLHLRFGTAIRSLNLRMPRNAINMAYDEAATYITLSNVNPFPMTAQEAGKEKRFISLQVETIVSLRIGIASLSVFHVASSVEDLLLVSLYAFSFAASLIEANSSVVEFRSSFTFKSIAYKRPGVPHLSMFDAHTVAAKQQESSRPSRRSVLHAAKKQLATFDSRFDEDEETFVTQVALQHPTSRGFAIHFQDVSIVRNDTTPLRIVVEFVYENNAADLPSKSFVRRKNTQPAQIFTDDFFSKRFQFSPTKLLKTTKAKQDNENSFIGSVQPENIENVSLGNQLQSQSTVKKVHNASLYEISPHHKWNPSKNLSSPCLFDNNLLGGTVGNFPSVQKFSVQKVENYSYPCSEASQSPNQTCKAWEEEESQPPIEKQPFVIVRNVPRS